MKTKILAILALIGAASAAHADMGADVGTMFTGVAADLTDVLVTVVPVIVPVGVLIIGVFLAWKLIKKFAGSR